MLTTEGKAAADKALGVQAEPSSTRRTRAVTYSGGGVKRDHCFRGRLGNQFFRHWFSWGFRYPFSPIEISHKKRNPHGY